MRWTSLLPLLCCGAAPPAAAADDRPIVGILTLPSIEGLPGNHSYLPASYVKWIESAGARVAPVRFDLPRDALRALASRLSGVVLTGGSNPVFDPTSGAPTPYFEAALSLYGMATGAAGRGAPPLPLWGTCLGFELVSCFASGAVSRDNFLGYYDAENLTLPLEFSAAAGGSRLFGGADAATMRHFRTLPVTLNEHSRGVSPASVAGNALVRVLATNVDRRGARFVSAMEIAGHPVFATQFHPERPAYEWFTDRDIPHSTAAVSAMAYLASTFVAEARKRRAAPFLSTQAEEDALIYSWRPRDTRVSSDYYEQTYFFPRL